MIYTKMIPAFGRDTGYGYWRWGAAGQGPDPWPFGGAGAPPRRPRRDPPHPGVRPGYCPCIYVGWVCRRTGVGHACPTHPSDTPIRHIYIASSPARTPGWGGIAPGTPGRRPSAAKGPGVRPRPRGAPAPPKGQGTGPGPM